MKKLMFALVLWILLLGGVSAYYYNYDAPSGTRYTFGVYGASADNYWNRGYYGGQVYRIYERDLDYWGYRVKREAVDFVVNSYYQRYSATAGQSSGEAFCSGCSKSEVVSNWRNKPAYNVVYDGKGSDSYYYKPTYDASLQKFNWRF